MVIKKQDIEDKLRRRSRRRMAWISLFSILLYVFLIMFYVSLEKIKELSGIMDMFMVCMVSIVLGYLGIATYDDLNVMKRKSLKKDAENETDETVEEVEETPKKKK